MSDRFQIDLRGIIDFDLPVAAGLADGPGVTSAELALRRRDISRQHALDRRNGNHWNVTRLGRVAGPWHALS